MFTIRPAVPGDEGFILKLIIELAEYEKLAHEVVATEEILHEWLFEKEKARVLIAEEDGVGVGYALYFYNFSTFLGRAGIYLEDLYVRPAYRKRGYGKALLRRLAQIAQADDRSHDSGTCVIDQHGDDREQFERTPG